MGSGVSLAAGRPAQAPALPSEPGAVSFLEVWRGDNPLPLPLRTERPACEPLGPRARSLPSALGVPGARCPRCLIAGVVERPRPPPSGSALPPLEQPLPGTAARGGVPRTGHGVRGQPLSSPLPATEGRGPRRRGPCSRVASQVGSPGLRPGPCVRSLRRRDHKASAAIWWRRRGSRAQRGAAGPGARGRGSRICQCPRRLAPPRPAARRPPASALSAAPVFPSETVSGRRQCGRMVGAGALVPMAGIPAGYRAAGLFSVWILLSCVKGAEPSVCLARSLDRCL